MADPHWTSYVGMASGMAGVLMAFFSGMKINKIKSLDLRIEFKRTLIDSDRELNSLQERMAQANRSRTNMSAALGRTGSGMMKQWAEDFEKNQGKLERLKLEIPDKDEKYGKLKPSELEDKLIEIHALQGRISTLTDFYTESMKKDEDDGRQLKDDRRASIK
jgi:hypothetical protein